MSISWLLFAMTLDSQDRLSALKPLCCGTHIHPGLEVVGVSSEFQTQPVHIGHNGFQGIQSQWDHKGMGNETNRKSHRPMRKGVKFTSVQHVLDHKVV